MRYIINTPVLTSYGTWTFTGPLSQQEARLFLSNDFVSALGHQGAAQFISERLGIEIPVNRITITMQPGDSALIIWLKHPPPEGRILSAQEMQSCSPELALLKFMRK